MNNSNKCSRCGSVNDAYASECLECLNDLNSEKSKKSIFATKNNEETLDTLVKEALNYFQCLSTKSDLKIGFTTDIEVIEIVSRLESSNPNFVKLGPKTKFNLILDHLLNRRKHQVKHFCSYSKKSYHFIFVSYFN